MPCVTIELADATVESVEDFAAEEHDGDRERAINELLDEWLERR